MDVLADFLILGSNARIELKNIGKNGIVGFSQVGEVLHGELKVS